MARTDHLEIDMARDIGVNREPGSKVPAAEVESRADDEVGDLRHSLGANKGEPVVCFGLVRVRIILFLVHR